MVVSTDKGSICCMTIVAAPVTIARNLRSEISRIHVCVPRNKSDIYELGVSYTLYQ